MIGISTEISKDKYYFKIVSNSVEDTLRLGMRIGEIVTAGDIITLSGELGAGKTNLTKGIALGLGISKPVSSPTFTIIKEYNDGRLPLYHFDLYRLGESAIYEDLGYEEYLYGSGVCVIEWADYIAELLPKDILSIIINHDANHDINQSINHDANQDTSQDTNQDTSHDTHHNTNLDNTNHINFDFKNISNNKREVFFSTNLEKWVKLQK